MNVTTVCHSLGQVFELRKTPEYLKTGVCDIETVSRPDYRTRFAERAHELR
jgi:hypothetical protein